MLQRPLALKLLDSVVHRIFKAMLTAEEYDALLIALTKAIREGEDE
jgi:hypothetical protein